MTSNRIFLSSPHIGEYERVFVEEAFSTNWIAPLGPNVDAFEYELAEYAGVAGAVVLSSGTAAIHLALKLLGVQQGDLVFCSSLTFVASANPILYQGATPIFIDSEPESWNMSPKALEKAFHDAQLSGKFPKAVIVVNLYGQSADLDPIMELCNYYNVPVIEDAAESLGATYKSRKSGSIGYFGIYSFNGNKIITTSGGGALISNDLDALDKARFWATQAREPAKHYQHIECGYNYRMSNVLAGIGRGQLRVLEERVRARREVSQVYLERLSKFKGISFMPEATFGRSTRWLTVVTLDPQLIAVTPSEIINELEAANIESRPVWKPLHRQPLFEKCLYYPHKEHESISDILFARGLCLPSGSNMRTEDQEKIIYHLESILNSGMKKY
ncbi:DegT/DnrJ/EryC1/StrS family aminotransferase [Xylanibacillus composti]|uniref:Aminotransferase n=1 Tax=Xylanibacillus composti TaxID=1572762 RepID=A0A8J4H5C6_9BACL|nr:aminotransferase class I/II-fold pyridoxal phosphate-dependent enzyme [Xylanibacillus composti]GIQ71248.1 aminotransferase [Xylanibacillus composti]